MLTTAVTADADTSVGGGMAKSQCNTTRFRVMSLLDRSDGSITYFQLRV